MKKSTSATGKAARKDSGTAPAPVTMDGTLPPSMYPSRESEVLRYQTHILGERVKELNCLYSISKLVGKRDTGLEDILRAAVTILPTAWQYPEIAASRMRVRDEEVRTPNFAQTSWKQECPIIANGMAVGEVEVCYLEKKPTRDEGPFLEEERKLINVVAQLLGEIVERKWAEEMLLAYQKQLQSLAAQITKIEEEERRQLAADLHDRIGQNLAIVQIKLGLLPMEGPLGKKAGVLREIQDLMERTIAETRSLMFDICPPVLYEFGLGAAMEWLAEETFKRYKLLVEFTEEGQSVPIPDDLRAALFRAARELLANVVKHAKAKKVGLSLHWEAGGVRVHVTDDGVGFDVAAARERAMAAGSFGLFSIQERLKHLKGKAEVVSSPGAGTSVTLVADCGEGRSGGRET